MRLGTFAGRRCRRLSGHASIDPCKSRPEPHASSLARFSSRHAFGISAQAGEVYLLAAGLGLGLAGLILGLSVLIQFAAKIPAG